MSARRATKIEAYVEAVRELRRLRGLTPTEEFAAERARTIKAASAKASELYRTLSGGELGKARRILEGREEEGRQEEGRQEAGR